MGDPAGIGPEVVAKLWAEGGLPPAFVIGDEAILNRAIGIVGARLALRVIATAAEAEARPGQMDLLPASRLPADLPFGASMRGRARPLLPMSSARSASPRPARSMPSSPRL